MICAAACPQGRAPTPRGVVLISIDALGARHVGAWGHARPTTPALDALAREGALFERAITPQVWTLTAHASMLSGLYPKTHGAWPRGPARPGATMLAEILHEQGFATAAFTGAGGYMKPGSGIGRGFDTFGVDRATANGGRDVLAWLKARADARRFDPDHRFFLFLHFYDVHSDEGTQLPYQAPLAFRRRFLPDGGRSWERRGDTGLLMRMQVDRDWNARDLEVLHALYDAEVLHADQQRLAPVLRTLDRLDLARDTLLIVTADHGEELFEHGRTTHQQPYDETSRVPLVLRGPGIDAGVRVPQLVELVDLMPTVLGALGLPVPAHVQGESLLPLLRGEAPRTPDAHIDGLLDGLAGRYPSGIDRDIDDVPWTLVAPVAASPREEPGPRRFWLDGEAELYRLDRDPLQQHDLSAQEPALTRQLAGDLLAWLHRTDAEGRALGSTDAPEPLLSEEERAHLRALGYAE